MLPPDGYDPPRQHVPDFIRVQPGRFAPQQVFNAQGPECRKGVFPVKQFVQRGHRVEAEAVSFQLLGDGSSPGAWR